MTPEAARVAAQIIAKARWATRPVSILNEAFCPATVEEGYQVQVALHALQAKSAVGRRAGFKIGCTTQVMQDYLGIDHPCAGGIMDRDTYHGRASLNYADFVRPGVECEIVVRLGSDIPTGTENTPDNVAIHIDSVMIGIEIVDDRYTDFRAIGLPTLIADDFFNAGCVLGKPLESWRTLNLPTLEGGFSINDQAYTSGRGADIMGHPMVALAWLADHMTMTNRQLKAGDFVMLGSVVKTHWFDKPGEAVAEIKGLGAVSVVFA
mgnify:CR=1 FL=1